MIDGYCIAAIGRRMVTLSTDMPNDDHAKLGTTFKS